MFLGVLLAYELPEVGSDERPVDDVSGVEVGHDTVRRFRPDMQHRVDRNSAQVPLLQHTRLSRAEYLNITCFNLI